MLDMMSALNVVRKGDGATEMNVLRIFWLNGVFLWHIALVYVCSYW